MYVYIHIYIYTHIHILVKDPCHNDTAISTSLESILHRGKRVPTRCLEHPKSTQKWSREPFGALQGAQGAPWDDPECHRHASGSSR